MANWQDDYYAGSSDYPLGGDDEANRDISFDPWDDPAHERAEGAE